jgi:hypothetical protein
MNSLATKHNRREIRKALDSLPDKLDDIYDEAMKRIRSQDENDAHLAERVLYWVSYALKPLTVMEIQHALAVEPGDKYLDEEALTDEILLVSVCAGLVTIDQGSKILRLVHYTTQEYFQRTRITQFPNAQSTIATSCLTYTLFDVFVKDVSIDRLVGS